MEKEISLKFENEIYLCKLESTDSNLLNIELSKNLFPKYKGSVELKNIYEQIRAFDEYTMEEVFSVMKDISQEKFKLIKESDKFKLDIAFTVMKKDKHLLINLNEIIESNDDIIKRLIQLNKNQEEKIKALEKEIDELKKIEEKIKDKTKEETKEATKEEIKERNDDISKYINEKEDEGVNIKVDSLLVLQDGRISLGIIKTYEHKKFKITPEIYIYDHINSNIMIIPDIGPQQTQLKNGLLLVAIDNKCEMYELTENDYHRVGAASFYGSHILYMGELSNNLVAFALDKNIIAFYQNSSMKYELDLWYKECKFILNLKDNEMLYISCHSNSKEKAITFYNYEKKKEIKAIHINIDFDNIIVSRISNNIIAIYELQKITLIDTNNHEIIKSIENQKNIHCLYALKDKYLIVAKAKKLEQYEFEEEGKNLKLISEKNDIEINDNIKNIGCLKDGKLVLLSSSGEVKILTMDKIQ